MADHFAMVHRNKRGFSQEEAFLPQLSLSVSDIITMMGNVGYGKAEVLDGVSE